MKCCGKTKEVPRGRRVSRRDAYRTLRGHIESKLLPQPQGVRKVAELEWNKHVASVSTPKRNNRQVRSRECP